MAVKVWLKKIVEPTKRPKICIPKAVMEEWGYPRTVYMFYDEKTKSLIIKPLEAEEDALV